MAKGPLARSFGRCDVEKFARNECEMWNFATSTLHSFSAIVNKLTSRVIEWVTVFAELNEFIS